MKAIFKKSAYLLIVIVLLFAACEPEEDPATVFPVKNGSFQTGGKVYATNYATLTDEVLPYIYDSIAQRDTIINDIDTVIEEHFPIVRHDFCQNLEFSNVNYNETAKEVYSVLFHFQFPDSIGLGLLTYSYLSRENKKYDDQKNFYMPNCAYVSDGKLNNYSNCKSGSLTISRNKDSYSFSYELIFENDTRVNGNYNGSITDFSGVTYRNE